MTNYKTWFEQFSKERFSENGYSDAPLGYADFLPLIDRPGRIVELGCGNGLLLRFLRDHSVLPLLPFGLDVNEQAIGSARDLIWRERPEAFARGNACDAKIPGTPCQIMIANPVHATDEYGRQENGLLPPYSGNGTVARFVRRCWDHVALGGRLILFVYVGQLREFGRTTEAFERELREIAHARRVSASGRYVFYVAERTMD